MGTEKYVKGTSFVEKQIGDELILVPLTDQVANMSEVFTLNEVGAFIWECLAIPLSLSQLADKVVEAFDVNIENATHDVALFLEQAKAKQIVKWA